MEEFAEEVLSGMPETTKAAVSRAIDGESYEKIAEQLGLKSADATRVRVDRALAKIRDRVEKKFGPIKK